MKSYNYALIAMVVIVVLGGFGCKNDNSTTSMSTNSPSGISPSTNGMVTAPGMTNSASTNQ